MTFQSNFLPHQQTKKHCFRSISISNCKNHSIKSQVQSNAILHNSTDRPQQKTELPQKAQQNWNNLTIGSRQQLPSTDRYLFSATQHTYFRTWSVRQRILHKTPKYYITSSTVKMLYKFRKGKDMPFCIMTYIKQYIFTIQN